MIGYLLDFQFDIETALASSDDVCQPERITITAGEPAAPSGPCKAVWIWASRIEDEAAFETDACIVRSRLTISYRIDVCYTETVDDATDTTHLDAAECLYSLMDRIWWGIVTGKDTGTLAGSTNCDRITILPLITDQREGGIVSATGEITIDYTV